MKRLPLLGSAPHAPTTHPKPTDASSIRAALVAMPFVSLRRPSIQLGLLKAICDREGLACDTLHLNLDCASRLDAVLHEAIAEGGRTFIGDWLFAKEAFPEHANREADEFLSHPEVQTSAIDSLGLDRNLLIAFRENGAREFIDHVLATVDWHKYGVVGFSSTFQQNVASLALARRLKEKYPSIVIVFGGANAEGEMGHELLRSFRWLDVVALGEGDVTWPTLLNVLQSSGDLHEVPGIAFRSQEVIVQTSFAPLVENLDISPVPNYDEYFERAEALGLLTRAPRREVDIPFESARGCWWGAKHHCTFCGLNGQSMRFRSKSPSATREQLVALARRYRSFRFFAVDNIVDPSYVEGLFDRLAEEEATFELFYEVKSNLTRDKLRRMAAGGVRAIQPGIESLNTNVLRLMKKGVTAIQNVNTLRWAAYYDLRVGWNLLYGFPGEREEDYVAQLEVLKRISHLAPPSSVSRIWLERFSPLYVQRERYPATRLEPFATYRFVYPPQVDLEKLAYFFDYALADTLPDATHADTKAVVSQWRDKWSQGKKPRLQYFQGDSFMQIEDTRDAERPQTFTFDGPLANLYQSCTTQPRTASYLKQELELPWTESDIRQALDRFVELGISMREGEAFLSLALRARTVR